MHLHNYKNFRVLSRVLGPPSCVLRPSPCVLDSSLSVSSGCHAIAISLAFTALQHFLLRLLSLGSHSPPFLSFNFFFFSAAVRLLAIFHMQHATDVFMFSVCAAHKKVNERHPRRRRFMVTVFIFISVSTSVFETGKLVNCWNCSCSWRSGRDDNGSGQGNGSQLSN